MRVSAPRMAEMRNFGNGELRVFNCYVQPYGSSANLKLWCFERTVFEIIWTTTDTALNGNASK